MKKIFTVVFLAVLLAACSSKSGEITDPGKPIEARAGEQFTIVIESNATTGYHWEVVFAESDEDKVQFISDEYMSTADPGLVGGGGVEVLTFKALSAGEARIVLGYFPPSPTPAEPERTETFTVQVK